MPLDNYTCFMLLNCSIETFSEYIKQVDNLGRLAVIGNHIDCNTRLSVWYNIGLENTNSEWLI